MMPPPAMTTSALSTYLGQRRFARALHHAPDLEDHLQCGEDRDLLLVEGRRNLDDVEPDQLRTLGRAAQQLQRLASGQTARRRNLGPRCECRVKHIDVERDVDLVA